MITTLNKRTDGAIYGQILYQGEPVNVMEVGESEGRPYAEVMSLSGEVDWIDPECLNAPWNDQELSIKEIAPRFDLVVNTLARAVKDGRVLSRKIGRDHVTTAGAVEWAIRSGSLKSGRVKSDKDRLLEMIMSPEYNKLRDVRQIVYIGNLWSERGQGRYHFAEGILEAQGIAWDETAERWVGDGPD